MPILLLRRQLGLGLLLRSKVLPSCFILGVLFCLSLFQGPASFSLLLLLLPLGQLLFELDLMFSFGLLFMLHSNVFEGLESRETRLEGSTSTSIVHCCGLRPSSASRPVWLESFVHNKHEPLLFGGQRFVGSKFCHRALPSLRRRWRIHMKRAFQVPEKVLCSIEAVDRIQEERWCEGSRQS